MADLEKPLTRECVCQGSGQYRVAKPTSEITFYLKWGKDDIPAKLEHTETRCSFHWENPGRDIYYPDGWEEEDLRAWCKAQKVPEPEWLLKSAPPWSIFDKHLAAWVKEAMTYAKPFWQYQAKAAQQQYHGGKKIQGNFEYASWDGANYSTYGQVTSASQIQQMAAMGSTQKAAVLKDLEAKKAAVDAHINEKYVQELAKYYSKPLQFKTLTPTGLEEEDFKS